MQSTKPTFMSITDNYTTRWLSKSPLLGSTLYRPVHLNLINHSDSTCRACAIQVIASPFPFVSISWGAFSGNGILLWKRFVGECSQNGVEDLERWHAEFYLTGGFVATKFFNNNHQCTLGKTEDGIQGYLTFVVFN